VTDTRSPGWAYIVSHGGTYTWEVWMPSDANGDSMSHAWGANVLVDLQQSLLGVTPTSPAFATMTIRPPSSGLQAATGTVPTQHGPVHVSWARSSSSGASSQFQIDVTIPPNSSAMVMIPAPGQNAVSENGHPLRHDHGVRVVGKSGPYVEVEVGSGRYHFQS
ncbi:MAG: alpha-L-rhamnosidase C-terminal domain-containing protein, partial [Acidimicrobiales bacterium]